MTSPDLFSAATSRALREQGLAIAESYPNDRYITKARSVAEMLAVKNGRVTINDVLKICPKPNEVSHNALGSIMRSKNLRLVSYTPSDKVQAHARHIGIFEYASKEI